MAEGRALITEDDILKKLLDQTEIGIVKENNDGDDDDFNNLELLGLTDTEKFIDKKYIDVQIMKAVGNIKQMIRDEVHKLHTSQEKPQQNDSKDSMLNGIDGDGISNKDTCVSVKSFGGSTTKDMIDYIKPSARKKPNKIIVHVGTIELKP